MHDLLLKTAYHIAEYESLKILVELGRRIEDGSTTISLTNGDISHLSNELKWFQCLLWYRKCCKITNL